MINTVEVASLQGTKPRRIPLVSECPGCKHERVQWYSPGGLRRLLTRGHPVEAYCPECDGYWRISATSVQGLQR